jgi:uncharacterized protein YcbX
MDEIGRLRFLRRYPVKSMAGEDLAEVFVTYAGLAGDRVHAFVDRGNHSDFPWMTGRQGSQMILFRSRFLRGPETGDGHPAAERFAAEVTTPEGEKYRVGEPRFTEFLEKRFSKSLEYRFSERSMGDCFPISILSLPTVETLSGEVGLPLDHRRFRANFIIEWKSSEPFQEDKFVGRQLQIGEKMRVSIVMKDARCRMITLDPETAAAAPQVLETVTKRHGGCTGVYGAVLQEGIVRTGDPVYAA